MNCKNVAMGQGGMENPVIKKLIIASVVALLFLCLGCSTTTNTDVNTVAHDYYTQKRTDDLIFLSGVTRIAVEGSNMTVRLATPNLPLSIIPKDPSIVEPLLHTALAAFGIYQAAGVMSTLAERPQTVEPTVVHPEIVTVPAVE